MGEGDQVREYQAGVRRLTHRMTACRRDALYLGNRFRENHRPQRLIPPGSGRDPTIVPIACRLWVCLKLERGEVPA